MLEYLWAALRMSNSVGWDMARESRQCPPRYGISQSSDNEINDPALLAPAANWAKSASWDSPAPCFLMLTSRHRFSVSG